MPASFKSSTATAPTCACGNAAPHETQACGTGARAAAVAAISQGWMDSPVSLDLPGGRLHIEWAGPGKPVMMTGPAVRVYEGQVRL